MIEILNEIINYILQNEMEDFADNPSKIHVYYKALVLREGEIEANKYLKQAQKDLRGV
jgi:hypothetical protein